MERYVGINQDEYGYINVLDESQNVLTESTQSAKTMR